MILIKFLVRRMELIYSCWDWERKCLRLSGEFGACFIFEERRDKGGPHVGGLGRA